MRGLEVISNGDLTAACAAGGVASLFYEAGAGGEPQEGGDKEREAAELLAVTRRIHADSDEACGVWRVTAELPWRRLAARQPQAGRAAHGRARPGRLPPRPGACRPPHATPASHRGPTWWPAAFGRPCWTTCALVSRLSPPGRGDGLWSPSSTWP
jgi:hypothetical protein